jgi:CheY-like chemotaxis protein
MKILLVEDDDLVRTVAVDALEEAGFDVIEAVTGEEAMERCRERVADILFTDIRLPGRVDGWEIAERCREFNPDLPVVYATGFSVDAPRLVPGSRLLHKPYQLEQVIDTIRDMVGRNPTTA